MRWFAVCGSFKNPDRRIEADVREAVTEIVGSGDGIACGGSLGVDYIATEAVMGAKNRRKRLRVIIPAPLEVYASHYRRQAAEGVIGPEQAEELIAQLKLVRAVGRAALIELDYNAVDQTSQRAKSQAVVDLADHLLAFSDGQDPETEAALDRAQQRNIPATVKNYQVD